MIQNKRTEKLIRNILFHEMDLRKMAAGSRGNWEQYFIKAFIEFVGRKEVSKGSDNINIWTVEYLWGLNKMLLWKCLSPCLESVIGIQLQWLMESHSQIVKTDLKNSVCLEFSYSAFSKEKVSIVDYRISYLKGTLNITDIR